jgi:hypothetical protein
MLEDVKVEGKKIRAKFMRMEKKAINVTTLTLGSRPR